MIYNIPMTHASMHQHSKDLYACIQDVCVYACIQKRGVCTRMDDRIRKTNAVGKDAGAASACSASAFFPCAPPV